MKSGRTILKEKLLKQINTHRGKLIDDLKHYGSVYYLEDGKEKKLDSDGQNGKIEIPPNAVFYKKDSTSKHIPMNKNDLETIKLKVIKYNFLTEMDNYLRSKIPFTYKTYNDLTKRYPNVLQGRYSETRKIYNQIFENFIQVDVGQKEDPDKQDFINKPYAYVPLSVRDDLLTAIRNKVGKLGRLLTDHHAQNIQVGSDNHIQFVSPTIPNTQLQKRVMTLTDQYNLLIDLFGFIQSHRLLQDIKTAELETKIAELTEKYPRFNKSDATFREYDVVDLIDAVYKEIRQANIDRDNAKKPANSDAYSLGAAVGFFQKIGLPGEIAHVMGEKLLTQQDASTLAKTTKLAADNAQVAKTKKSSR